MKTLYLTWGIGQGSKLLAEHNALADANLNKIKIKTLDSDLIPAPKIVFDKHLITKMSGEHPGLLIQKNIKGESVVMIQLGISEDKLVIGTGKGGSYTSAERRATADMEQTAKRHNLTNITKVGNILARSPVEKGKYSCAIVALVLE